MKKERALWIWGWDGGEERRDEVEEEVDVRGVWRGNEGREEGVASACEETGLVRQVRC